MPQRQPLATPESFATFGELLVHLRKRARLTQEELGRAVGYSRSQVTLLEKNQRLPAPATVKALFVPALDLDNVPDLAQRLIELASSARRPHTNLPAPVSALIGREHDTTRVRDYFLAPDKRLVTLVGPPGIGKTRLSLQVATELLPDFADGVFFVPLAPITDLNLVAPTVAQTLGFPDTGGLRVEERLKAGISQRQMLLILDNFEQIIEAAPLTLELLAACPRLKVLVTSRESLRVPGEWLYPVPPLALPSESQLRTLTLEAADQFSALHLFAERARAVRPDFSVAPDNVSSIAAICQRLDGLPLAIELIASRLRLMSPQTLLTELDAVFSLHADGMRGVPTRQKTLHHAIDWSFDLLSEVEQTLLARLSVCLGGCTLATARAIAPAPNLISKLTSLVDKSLLYRTIDPDGEVRYNLLVMIREFALERLRERGEETEVRDQHAAYFLAVVEEADRALRGPGQLVWLDRLEQEHDNFRAALEDCLKDGSRAAAQSALRMVAALEWFWRIRGHFHEASDWLARTLAMPAASEHTLARAWALYHIGRLHWFMGDLRSARAYLEDSCAMMQELGPTGKCGLAYALSFLGKVVLDQGELTSARARLDESLKLCREVGDHWATAETLFHLGMLQADMHDDAAVRLYYAQSQSMFRELGDKWSLTRLLMNYSGLAIRQGEGQSARLLAEEALSNARELGFVAGVIISLQYLGDAARVLHDCEGAESLFAEGLALAEDASLKTEIAYSLYGLGFVALEQKDHAEAALKFRRYLTLSHELGHRWEIAEAVAGLGCVAAGAGMADRAARLLGAADMLLAGGNFQLNPMDRVVVDQYTAAARSELGEAAFEIMWAEGRALTTEQVVELALAQ